MPSQYADFEKTLKTGDLLYIKGSKTAEVTHVVLWVGSIGQSPNKVPLILDSTGSGRKDANGVSIPDGVHLREFKEKSWYHESASHAWRVVGE